MTDRNGIEIDYCPDCRGVWLDRGELDKIIERSAPNARDSQQDRRPDSRQHSSDSDYYQKKKKKGLFDDLFDF
jgi:Zn-finger nucleic acid-binding protein